ncbi:hypothetical protein D3C79_49150 [compost metagenome]
MTKVLTANFAAHKVMDRDGVGSTLVVLGSKLCKEVGFSLGEGLDIYLITTGNGRRAVGMIQVSLGTVTSLYVEKPYRRMGIGTALFNLVKGALEPGRQLKVVYPASSEEAFGFFDTLMPWEGQCSTVMGYPPSNEPVGVHMRTLLSQEESAKQKEQRASDINRLHDTNGYVFFEPVTSNATPPFVTMEGAFDEEDLLAIIRLIRSRRIPKEGEPEEPGIDINSLR